MIRTIAVAVLCLTSSLAHAQRGATRVASQFEWRQDLDDLAERLPELHPDPWAKISEEAFRAEVAELRDRTMTISEGQTAFEISRIVALLGDQNSIANVARPMNLAPVLPVQFVWLSDGLYIHAAATRYRGLLGSKVLGMGGIPIDELKERASKYGSWENETRRQQVVAELLRYPAVLKLCGISSTRIDLPLEFERGEHFGIRELTSVPLGGTHSWTTWAQFVEGPMPVSIAASALPYTSAFLGESRVMFVSCNTQTEDTALPFADFVSSMLGQVAELEATRIVIDLRFNDDPGDSIVTPLIDALGESGWFREPGDVIVLVGRLTGATAAQDAMLLSERGAILMGTPSGGNPAGCAGRQELTLPNSGMKILVSTTGWTDDSVTSVVPDVTVPWSSEAFFKPEDPALNAALEYKPDAAGEG